MTISFSNKVDELNEKFVGLRIDHNEHKKQQATFTV